MAISEYLHNLIKAKLKEFPPDKNGVVTAIPAQKLADYLGYRLEQVEAELEDGTANRIFIKLEQHGIIFYAMSNYN